MDMDRNTSALSRNRTRVSSDHGELTTPAMWRFTMSDIDIGVLVSQENHHQYLAVASREQQQDFLRKLYDHQQCGDPHPLRLTLTQRLLIIKERTPKLEEELQLVLGPSFIQLTKRFHPAYQTLMSMIELDKAKFRDINKFANQLYDEISDTFIKMCDLTKIPMPEIQENPENLEKYKQYLKDRMLEGYYCHNIHHQYFTAQPINTECYICGQLVAEYQLGIHVVDEHFEVVHGSLTDEPTSPSYGPTSPANSSETPTYGPTSPTPPPYSPLTPTDGSTSPSYSPISPRSLEQCYICGQNVVPGQLGIHVVNEHFEVVRGSLTDEPTSPSYGPTSQFSSPTYGPTSPSLSPTTPPFDQTDSPPNEP